MNPLLPLEELIEKWKESSAKSRASLNRASDKDIAWSAELETNMNDLAQCAVELERVLRDSGLAELLEAGQAQVRELLTKHEYMNGACLCREFKLQPYGKKELDDFRAKQGNDWMTDIRWRYWLEHVLAALAKVKGKSA